MGSRLGSQGLWGLGAWSLGFPCGGVAHWFFAFIFVHFFTLFSFRFVFFPHNTHHKISARCL